MVYQENKNKVCMEKNERDSCTGNFCRINIMNLFVNDSQDKDKFGIDYFRKWKLLVDYFTKHYREDFSICSKKLLWDGNTSVNLKNCYHLHPRSVLGKPTKPKKLIFHLKRNPI